MFFEEGMEISDIHSFCQCTEEAVFKILHDARQRVLKNFDDGKFKSFDSVDEIVDEIFSKKDVGLSKGPIRYLVCDMLKVIGECKDSELESANLESEDINSKNWQCINLTKDKAESLKNGKIELSKRELNKYRNAVSNQAKRIKERSLRGSTNGSNQDPDCVSSTETPDKIDGRGEDIRSDVEDQPSDQEPNDSNSS